MTALIIDDTQILRRVLSEILVEFCGITAPNIFEASDGEEGLKEYKRLKPNVVFLDIAMPKLDGIETIQKMLDVDPGANIIMCTAASQKHLVQQCIRAGAKDYLLKPLAPERVAVAVKRVSK